MSSNFAGFKQVGEFIQQRPMIRTVRNPMDKATIVSIYPKEINDTKETIQPGKFCIPAGKYDEPGILVVGPSSWWRDIDIEQPLLEIPVSATQVAQSVIIDWCNGMLGCDMAGSMPGLFFVNGEVDKAEIMTKYKLKLAETKSKQDNWYKILIRLANSLWARSNGNPLVIWDEMRLAAKELGQDNLPWLKMEVNMQMVPCFACGTLRNPDFPMCPNCKNVDMSHPRAKEIKLAAG